MKSLIQAHGTLVLLDLEAPHLDHLIDQVIPLLEDRLDLGAEGERKIEEAIGRHADVGMDLMERSVGLVHEQVPIPDLRAQVLVRLKDPLPITDAEGNPIRFVWFLLSDRPTHPHMDEVAEFDRLMAQPAFREAAVEAATPEGIWEAYEEALDRSLHFGDVPEELRPTGRFMGGIVQDIRRRLPYYKSDFTDGLTSKSLASILFLFFACVAPAVAFGGLLSVLTDGAIGAVEMLVGTAFCGVVYALFSAQPLTILGSTGPVVIFMGILYKLCAEMEIPFLATLSWVGFWTMLILLILAATDASSWIRFFTRFTDEVFAGLISLIFIYEAVKDVVGVFAGQEVSYAAALLSLILAVGTYYVATALSQFRRSVYLRRWVREFLGDFGPALAIVAMTCVAFALHEVELETLAVPDVVATTSGRPWLVPFLEAPLWVWFASAIPGALMAILLYLDQNITVRLVNNPQYNLKKGAGYHLDLALVAILVGICSLFAIPWMVAATVRSLNHVRSLAETEHDHGEGKTPHEHVTSVVETRVTGLGVHLLVGVSLMLLPLLKLVPMSVLFGLFLYMGVASMSGNQLFERLRLWVVDPNLYPPTYYLRAVPTPVVHKFTAIQAACLAALWAVKASRFGILFPLMIGMLVPVRMALEKFFKPEHLALLDAEEEPDEDEYRAMGP